MAIRDLLWACPACGAPGSLVPARRREVCTACGASVRRGRAATIIVEAPGRDAVTRPAWEWCDALPAPPDAAEPIVSRAILREASEAWPLREGKELLGFVERFGEPVTGRVTLEPDAIRFTPAEGRVRAWPLLDLTAVQPASSALQLKTRDRPVVTLKFLDGSVRLWELRIQDALRNAFRAADRGEIVEFQPRIAFR